ncbi:hypothetical protein KQ51_01171 [Candidatus Izimaplasma bacterium HR1]|jgi:hypothetical protein|uniref:hypothetical protein n=1 Tax=Candidatus Izimoplasma sp. HR1 TaxID=1541959 RepID=UPI0004F6E76E|nr:hypothetical protein KQ51_01171 [Candidatus Izimaplasma bacterium HR1]
MLNYITPVMLTDSTGFSPVRGVTGDDSKEYRPYDDILNIGVPDELSHDEYCSIGECYDDYYNNNRDYNVFWASVAVGSSLAIVTAKVWFAANPEPVTKVVGSILIIVVGTAFYSGITYVVVDSIAVTPEEKLARCIKNVLIGG